MATVLRSSTAIIGMNTFHCQRIPVAHRTMGGRFMGVSHQRRDWFAREEVTLAEWRSLQKAAAAKDFGAT